MPNQQDCFPALEAEGCIAFCCFPCSILGSVTEPKFLFYAIHSSSRVTGALTTVTVTIVSSAPVGAPSELRILGMVGSGVVAGASDLI